MITNESLQQTTGAGSFRRVLGSAPGGLWRRGSHCDLQAPDATVVCTACKDPCRADRLPRNSAAAAIHACHRGIFSMPGDDVVELLLTPAGRELNRRLETLADLDGGVSRGESRAQFEGADLADPVAGASQRSDRYHER